MVLMLLAMLLLASLVFYVMNMGRAVNARVVTQHTADTAATAFAGWVARNFNTVAMNNVGISRAIALVEVLDAVPMAVRFTYEDQIALRQALDVQLHRGISASWVRTALQTLRGEVEEELLNIQPVDELFNHSLYDIRTMTFYHGPDGRGHLWRGMEAMDGLNRAAMDNLVGFAETNQFGSEVNLASIGTSQPDGVGVATYHLFADPPGLPWRRGSFDDFERPVTDGLLMLGTDDQATNRGPFDVLFAWRQPVDGSGVGYEVPGTSKVAGGGSGSSPISSGVGHDGSKFVTTEFNVEKYRVYGPYDWMINRLRSYSHDKIRHSRFAWWMNQIAGIKLGYLWPGNSSQTVVEPQWITSFEKAVSISDGDRYEIMETAFVAVEIKSRYARTSPRFLSPGSWVYVAYGEHQSPRVVRRKGWEDPRDWGLRQTDQYIWRDEWDYEAYYDSEIGLNPKVNANGTSELVHVYRVDHFMFVGVNVGDEVEVRNPNNFSNRTDMPAPIDFDHKELGTDQRSRDYYFNVLAVVTQPDRSLFWPSRFDTGKPYPYTVAIAQAAVFNNHSWDLWTQMWHCHLVPVWNYSIWADHFAVRLRDLDNRSTPATTDLVKYYEYLVSLEPLAMLSLTH